MLIWIIILGGFLLGSVFTLYKMRNIGTFLLALSTSLMFVFIRNYRLCALDSISEDCVWGYLAYVPAFVVGVFLYLIVSAIKLRFYDRENK